MNCTCFAAQGVNKSQNCIKRLLITKLLLPVGTLVQKFQPFSLLTQSMQLEGNSVTQPLTFCRLSVDFLDYLLDFRSFLAWK